MIITGLDVLQREMNVLRTKVYDTPEMVAEMLAEGMRERVHVISGFLRSTIYSRKDEVGATAPYAEYEAGRDGEHDFPGLAIANLDYEQIADHLMEAF